MSTLAYIDADYGLISSCYAVEKELKWDDGLVTLHSELTEATQSLQAWLESKVLTPLVIDQGDVTLCLSAPKRQYWRHRINPTYKSNRRNTRPPLALAGLKEWVKETFNTLIYPALEADDVLGLHCDDGILVSNDKDLKTIPGEHFNPDKPEEGVISIDQQEADYNHQLQTLIGDSTDGYSGCPKIGPVTAKKLLNGTATKKDAWKRIIAAFEKAGLSKSQALLNARMAYILRPGDYDRTTSEVSMWSFPE